MMYKVQDNIRSMLQNMHEAKETESEQAEEIQQAQEEVDTRPRKAYYKVERVEEAVLKESKEGWREMVTNVISLVWNILCTCCWW